MSDDGLLSQDEIDALMAGLGGGDDSGGDSGSDGGGLDIAGSDILPGDDGGGGDSGGDAVTEFSPEGLEPILKLMAEQFETVITTVINKTTDISIDAIGYTDSDDLAANHGQDHLAVKSGFEGGMEGELFFTISKPLTALLADLMMMGDGAAPYEDDHQDALTELSNQMMGAISTAMGTDLQINTTAVQANVSEFDPGSPPFGLEGSIQVKLVVQIEGHDVHNICLVLPQDLSQSMFDHCAAMNQGSDIGERGAEAPTFDESGFGAGAGGVPAVATTGMSNTGNPNIDMLLDVPLNVTIELGRANMSIRKILELGPGSIIELDRLSGEPVDLLVNDKVVAKGEVVVIDEYFGIRVISLVSPEERIKQLR